MAWYYDSHVHLSDPFYHSDFDHIVSGMERINLKACCVSMDTADAKKTLELAKSTDLVLPFIGIHPERARDDLDVMVDMIHQNNKSLSGIGEIGLDPTYCQSAADSQRQVKVFETLLGLAEKYQKPVSIHSRKSLDDVLQIMTSYSTKHALLHWFDGNKKQLQKAMDMDFFVSFGPVLIYAEDKQTLLSKTRQSKVLVETDGPVRFSRCFEMKPAQVFFIPSVILCVSKVLGKSFEETCMMLETNSESYLGI